MDIYREITRFYKGVQTEKRIIGTSLLKRNLYALKVGEGSPVGIATYAIHGREWISARLAKAHFARGVVGSVWILPLVNPDGALLSQRGLFSAKYSPYERFLSAYSDRELRLWKANARGVDLNVNFDAQWGKGKHNAFRRGAENYVGNTPFSEPESRALRDFTLEIAPDYTVSFHTKGEEIYWYFGQSMHTCLRDFRIGQALSISTGYPMKLAEGSVGGYKDWCIAHLGIPSYTVELGSDRFFHPLGRWAYVEIRKKCGGALYALSKAIQG
jgi:hypothetical protein